MRTTDRMKRAFEFLMQCKAEQRLFTAEDMARETGWARSSVDTYMSKKWRPHIQREGQWRRVTGFEGFDFEAFARLHSQNEN